MKKIKNFQAFTLAELLIISVIIGVVAVLIMPLLISNLSEKNVGIQTSDIRPYMSAALTQDVCIGSRLNDGKCIKNFGIPTPINTCNDTTWDRYGSNNSGCSKNYWAGAKKMCADNNMSLPSLSEFRTFYSKYHGQPGVPTTDLVVWTSEDDSSSMAQRFFFCNDTNAFIDGSAAYAALAPACIVGVGQYGDSSKSDSSTPVICIGD